MIGTKGFDAASPGPIGGTTPSTFNGTTLTLTDTSITTFTIQYDSTHRNRIFTTSNGTLIINQIDRSDFILQDNGTTVLRWISNTFSVNGNNSGFLLDSGSSRTAGRTRFAVNTSSSSGPGIGDGGADNTLAICIGGTDYVVVTSSTVTIRAATALKLGNAAVAGAVVPTHTVTIQDSTGTTYRVPCLV